MYVHIMSFSYVLGNHLSGLTMDRNFWRSKLRPSPLPDGCFQVVPLPFQTVPPTHPRWKHMQLCCVCVLPGLNVELSKGA